MSPYSKINFEETLLVNPCGNGVKSMYPNEMHPYPMRSLKVSQLLDLPFNVFFCNTEGVIQTLNENTAITCGFVSTNDAKECY